MRERRKSRIEAKAAHCDDALAVLGNAKVRRVDLAKVDGVTGGDRRGEEVTYVRAISGGQESFDILEDEGLGPALGNDCRKGAHV